MTRTSSKLGITLCLLLLGILAAIPAFAGSAVIGSVAGSKNATLAGQALLPNTTIFSGDSLRVSDGVAVVAVGSSSRMVFGQETVASFLRDTDEVTVLLSRGSVSLYHPNDGVALRVKAGEVSVLPGKGFKTLGEVAMIGGAVRITAKEGVLRVEGNGRAVDVAKGRTITISAKPARTPKGGPGGPAVGAVGGGSALQVATLGAAGAAAVLAGVSISRANDARDAAAAAGATAAQADADAKAAIAAANAANATAGAADADAISVGCALNQLAHTAGISPPSPFTPPSGTTCPPEI